VSAAKAKGTAAETAVVRFLQANGYPHAERRALAGAFDHGDIAGILGVVIEIKNKARTELAAWVDEARAEAVVRGPHTYDDLPVVWHKRRGKSDPGDWYVTMDGRVFVEFLRAWSEE
jgi:Holliday junction resolvase